MSNPLREADIQRACLDLLAAHRIFALRLNTGAMFGSHKGKRWAVRFGVPGMADILATPVERWMYSYGATARFTRQHILWCEVKRPKGIQSPEQAAFQAQVEGAGHCYLLVRDVDELESWLKEKGCL